jgi:hypothetical protein
VRWSAPRWTTGTLPAVALAGCVSARPLTEHARLSERQDIAILSGAHDINCAPKESVLAEANLEFATAAIADRKYARARRHLERSAQWVELVVAKTADCDPFICRLPAPWSDLDADADGYNDADDACPEDPEDFDGFDDEDGCPDRDNDGDGILDASQRRAASSAKTATSRCFALPTTPSPRAPIRRSPATTPACSMVNGSISPGTTPTASSGPRAPGRILSTPSPRSVRRSMVS